MENLLFIVTARGTDARLVNQVLLYLRNWEHLSDPTWDQCHIFRKIKDLGETDPSATVPPLQEFTGNEFEGMTLEAIESLMLERKKIMFSVLDDEGAQTKTLILVHQATDNRETSESTFFDEYNKMRVPWDEVSSIYSNLEIGNMSFEEFTTDDTLEYIEDPELARARNRWWTNKHLGTGLSESSIVKRDAAIKELQKLDLA